VLWNNALTELNDMLIGLYSRRESWERIATQAGLKMANLILTGAPNEVWFNILLEADKSVPSSIPTIVAIAAKEYPGQSELLNQILQRYQDLREKSSEHASTLTRRTGANQGKGKQSAPETTEQILKLAHHQIGTAQAVVLAIIEIFDYETILPTDCDDALHSLDSVKQQVQKLSMLLYNRPSSHKTTKALQDALYVFNFRVNEHLVRLESHIKKLRAICQKPSAQRDTERKDIQRNLDQLYQELQEFNGLRYAE
jgi:hypothetical protein